MCAVSNSLTQVWSEYLEQYADHEGDVKRQIIVAAYHGAEILGSLSRTLDRAGSHRALIDERIAEFEEGSSKAQDFEDCMLVATFTLYNHFNTLGHQFTAGSRQAEELMAGLDRQVKAMIESSGQIERSCAAVRACFPLLSLITLAADQRQSATPSIRKVEQRFEAGDSRATTPWEHLLNGLYRTVEMMQIFVILSDSELKGKVQQIASRFQEEDGAPDYYLKTRNGFCRLFELGHLLTARLAQTL
jgi:hypothetical protein